MNVFRRSVLGIGCLGVMIAAQGCANKDVVKKEETVTTTKAPAAPAEAKAAVSTQKAVEAIKPAAAAVPEASKQESSQFDKATAQSAFENIYFGFDGSDLNKAARDTLAVNAENLLKSNQDKKISIQGHCDARGSAEYNLALGERRAKAAAKYLMTMGVKPERVATISYGKERPAVQGNDEAAWSKNRRDEFVIQK